MPDIIKSVIFGIIEGITEWLPVSSTGHLIIAEEFLEFSYGSDSFYKMYSVVIQLGAVCAVAVLFFKRINPFELKNRKIRFKKNSLSLWKCIIIGCVPAGIVGILFNDVIDYWFYTYKTVSFALIIYGILFIIIEAKKKSSEPKFTTADEIDPKTALLIGGFQILSLIPGTSRSGTTIIGGMLLGASRTAASEFTFLMAIPIMAGASAVSLIDFGLTLTAEQTAVLLTGFVTAFVVSLLSVKWLMKFVKNHSFGVFGVYRIILGLTVLTYFSLKYL